jgi:hypothetical protein
MYNLNAMNRLLFFAVLPFLIVAPLISGCGGVPVSAHPTDKFVDTKEANTLVGLPIHTIYDRFGEPSFELKGTDRNYYIYISAGELDLMWDVFIPFVLLPADVYGDVDWVPIFCAVFETDKIGVINRFDSDWSTFYYPSWSYNKSLNINDSERLGLCLLILWTEDEAEQIYTDIKSNLSLRAQRGEREAAIKLAIWFGVKEPLERILGYGILIPSEGATYSKFVTELQILELLHERANQGAPDAQWELYQESPTAENLVWLCRAADQGQTNARNELGKLYFYGSERYRKLEDVSISPDLSQSCMWSHLAGHVQITSQQERKDVHLLSAPYESPEVERTAKAMTVDELAEAEKLILNWVLGQCDRDFSLYLGAKYAEDSDLVGLCMEADQGSFAARDVLGQVYLHGLSGVEPDLPRAYMWYHLAAKVYAPPSRREKVTQHMCDAMTLEQRSIAAKLLEERTPGKCEQDLLQ